LRDTQHSNVQTSRRLAGNDYSRRDGAQPTPEAMIAFREASGFRRVTSAAAIGIALGTSAALVAPWQGAVLLGWDVIAAVTLFGAWSAIRHYDALETRAHATKTDNSRAATHALLVAASLASLVGIAILLVKANNETGLQRFSLSALAVATVAVSWLLVHTTYTLRYAHQYYSETVGGVSFPGTEATDASYRDFAYLAFTVGMTFQVSDTEITHRDIRRSVFGHALLSYLFGAVIVAVTVNVIAGIVN
jgi:uncharacterized membrane protein